MVFSVSTSKKWRRLTSKRNLDGVAGAGGGARVDAVLMMSLFFLLPEVLR